VEESVELRIKKMSCSDYWWKNNEGGDENLVHVVVLKGKKKRLGWGLL
jgi:hypothetical protein